MGSGCRADGPRYECRLCSQVQVLSSVAIKPLKMAVLAKCGHFHMSSPHRHIGWTRSYPPTMGLPVDCCQEPNMTVSAKVGTVGQWCRGPVHPQVHLRWMPQ